MGFLVQVNSAWMLITRGDLLWHESFWWLGTIFVFFSSSSLSHFASLSLGVRTREKKKLEMEDIKKNKEKNGEKEENGRVEWRDTGEVGPAVGVIDKWRENVVIRRIGGL